VLPRPGASASAALDASRPVAARLGGRAALLLCAALVLFFVRQLREFHDPFATWSHDALLLLRGTGWGTTWIAAVLAAAVALVGFARAGRERRGGWPVATLAVVALGAFPALTGHASSGGLSALTLPADVLHVWAVGAWIGTLLVVLALERRQRRADPGATSVLPVLVPRFSPVAIASVTTLLVTGVLAAWVHLGSVGALFATTYGRLLLLKVGLVLGVLALGALNWRRLTPRLGEHAGQEAMRRAATVEFLVANVVLVVTAVLVRTSQM
jgi:copper transport protein